MIKLSVVIPVYNEEKRLPPTLDDVLKYLKKQDYEWEIILVNDGSTDKTVKIIKKYIQKENRIRLIDNKTNQGKGAVVKQGMLEARGDWRLFMDADSSTKIEELDGFWKYANDYQILIASRYCKNARILVYQSMTRRLMSRFGNILIQIFIGWRIKDTQCGFKLFSKNAAEKVFEKQTLKRWSFDIELVAIAKNHKFKIKEIPVCWKEAKGSKLKIYQTSYRTLRDLLKIKWNLIKGKY